MTNARQLIAMIRSHAAGDDERFLSIAEEIAGEHERLGRTKVAGDVQRLVESIRDNMERAKTAGGITPLVRPRGELAALVRATYPELNLGDLVLGADLDRQIRRVIREHRERVSLEERGLQPRRKFLFSGPPGTGKTMTASVIAGELNLPLFTVLLDGVITKFMGETAAKLRLIFDAMRNVRGVYFFDEVDALATSRGNDNDIGEARRMLNSFLQFLEEENSQSIIIAATNHKTLLDPAIFRRFQASFKYEKPSAEDAKRVLMHHLLPFDIENLDWAGVTAAVSNLSQADLAAAADDAARDAVLDNEGLLTAEVLIQALRDRLAIHGQN
ncbi:AAA family ATPase [Sphingomonas sp. PR090111-T3T-6A]|uniref:AAA family ATPase n=1 Tax=Sphingomonas sp. PR090111-T3T-6A TaxID=685778 RepID=UPI00037A5250|nr:ATP-binding protein [Sphingomonas sp. PR090111-T3T-6A]